MKLQKMRENKIKFIFFINYKNINRLEVAIIFEFYMTKVSTNISTMFLACKIALKTRKEKL